MAKMIDKKPEYKGEGKVWECFANNLPDEVVVYNQREVNGREFDFCILMKNVGLIVVEVKGWTAESIFDVAGVDEIIVSGYTKPEKSPKKQARAYRFGLLNLISDKFNVSPLIFDLVCYPFISKKEYYEKRLDVASEESVTIFKEDLENPIFLGNKLLNAYNQCKLIPHVEMDENLMAKIRHHFEPNFEIVKPLELSKQVPYSIVTIIPKKMSRKETHGLVEGYANGIKNFVFVPNRDIAESILYALEGELDDRNIKIDKNLLKIEVEASNSFEIENNSFRVFNFELYIVEELSDMLIEELIIFEGECTENEKQLLYDLAAKTTFNTQQFFIEHATLQKNILVKAGAGTGKTYSMVSRIAYLCNRLENPIVNIIEDIAMVTFTNEAAENMKNRLKQLFVNYFILTKNPKYLRYIEDINFMQISTIHKFAKVLIKESAIQLGLGDDFAITSGDHTKEEIYENYLNLFIEKMEKENPDFINEIKLPLYKFKRMLIEFSGQLYNKSIDIKEITKESMGQPPTTMIFFNEIIWDVIIAAEKEYKDKIQKLNKIDLREIMILLKNVVNQDSKEKTHLNYKYIFIDEFQDTDDAQIESFLNIQKIIGESCKLFVVGDLKQSIYRFRGATISAFIQLNATPEYWEEHTINTNYRTDKRLLEKMDTIFNIMGLNNWLPYEYEEDHLTSNLLCGECEETMFRCIPYHGKNEEQIDTLVELVLEEKNKILKLEKTRKLSDEEKTIAILVRENWQIENIVRMCKEKDENLEIKTKVGGELYQLDSSIDFCKLLMALTNANEPVYLIDFIESSYVKLDVKYQGLQHFSKDEQRIKIHLMLDMYFKEFMGKSWKELIQYAQANPVLVVLKNIYQQLRPWVKYSDDEEKQRFYKSNYELLLEKIIKVYSVDYLTLNNMASSMRINILTKQQEQVRTINVDTSGVTIFCTTVHKAKGLEYGTVILPYTGQAIDNLKKASTDVSYSKQKLAYSIKVDENRKDNNSNYDTQEEIGQRLCEEARILYVALTRSIRSCIWMKDVDKKSGMNWTKFLEV